MRVSLKKIKIKIYRLAFSHRYICWRYLISHSRIRNIWRHVFSDTSTVLVNTLNGIDGAELARISNNYSAQRSTIPANYLLFIITDAFLHEAYSCMCNTQTNKQIIKTQYSVRHL